jgi:hypothetical protein
LFSASFEKLKKNLTFLDRFCVMELFKLQDLQAVRIPICPPNQPELVGFRTFESSDDESDEEKRTRRLPFLPADPRPATSLKSNNNTNTNNNNNTMSTSNANSPPLKKPGRGRRGRARATNAVVENTKVVNGPVFVQSLLRFGKDQGAGFELSSRCFEALKFTLAQVEPIALRFAPNGLEVVGHIGRAFLSRDMFHNYPESLLDKDSNNFFSTKFDLLTSFMSDRKHFHVELKEATIDICGALLTLPKVSVPSLANEANELNELNEPNEASQLGPSIYTNSFREFLETCGSLCAKEAFLKFDRPEKIVSMVVKSDDNSVISRAPLEACYDDDPNHRHHGPDNIELEFCVCLNSFRILKCAKQIQFMFQRQAQQLLARFLLGGDSFVEYKLRCQLADAEIDVAMDGD